MSTVVLDKDKKADLAGPGIGDYKKLEKILPNDYHSLLTPKETQQAIFQVKRYIEDNLCKELNLMMVEVPLIVDVESGVNDMLDRDGSRTPIQFHISNDRNLHPAGCASGAGRDQMETGGAEAVRLQSGRGHLHRHARRSQGLFSGSRPFRLRRSMGLGARDHGGAAQPGLFEGDRQQDLESDCGSGKVWAIAVSAIERLTLSESPGEVDLPARRGNSRYVSGPAAQAARDGGAAEVSRGIHYWDWLAAEGWVSARDARRRLR